MSKEELFEVLVENLALPAQDQGSIISTAPVFARGVFFPLGFPNKEFFKRDAASSLPTTVSVAALIQTASPKEIYHALLAQKKEVLLSQEQIVTFCMQHESWLRTEGCGTLFFFKERNTICHTYVTYMNPTDKGHMLSAILYDEIKAGIYHKKFKHRVVFA